MAKDWVGRNDSINNEKPRRARVIVPASHAHLRYQAQVPSAVWMEAWSNKVGWY